MSGVHNLGIYPFAWTPKPVFFKILLTFPAGHSIMGTKNFVQQSSSRKFVRQRIILYERNRASETIGNPA